MKWILSFLLLISLTMRSQDPISGDWYHISTGRLVQMSITDRVISWNEKTFQFQDRERKADTITFMTMIRQNDIIGIVNKSNDTSDKLPYSLTVLKQEKNLRFLDLLMDCSDDSYRDTADMRKYFAACYLSDKMVMRLYSKSVIDSFKTLKPISGITKNDLARVNRSFKKKSRVLIKEFGEDKLLWIAPVIFQQVLTDLLVKNGYTPMITEDQAEKLFDFNFF